MKRPKLKSIELQNGQTLQSIIEEAKKLGVTNFSKVIVDVEAYTQRGYYYGEGDGEVYAVCDIKLKKIK